MQTSSIPKKFIPLRSPTPPLDSSSEELNDLSLDQELARLDDLSGSDKRPHFLDYQSIPPPGFDDQQRHAQVSLPFSANAINQHATNHLKGLPLTHAQLKAQKKMSLSAVVSLSTDGNANNDKSGKKHFLDENPIPPDYIYERQHRSLDREYNRKDRKDNGLKLQFDARRHSIERTKQKKMKEPSYAMSRFLENDDGPNGFNGNGIQLSDVNLTANPKVDGVYSLLSIIGNNNSFEMSTKFLELSKSPETCAPLRHSQCIPYLVQVIHLESDNLTKKQLRMALHNVVNYHPDDKAGRREAKVLRYIEQIMDYCEMLKKHQEFVSDGKALDSDNHPLQAMSSLMKISFDEEHRHAMCQLGALQTIASLVHYDHAVHGANAKDAKCISLRRYACMALTNLTFGDGNNKALLCSNKEFMKALVAQISTDADDLLQVTANVLRNLSWRADNTMKAVLNEIGTVTALTVAAMKNKNENTLRAILSALWNLSAHCSKNKAELCLVDGALLFLVEMLTYDAPSKTLSIVENAGGILRNVSSHIAVNEDFRKILRQRNCLGILLQQLKSESLTIVSNACGTLWNLSARCPEDQTFLWDNGAVPMLRSLNHSKHKMISNGSKVALKNLINFRPGEVNRNGLDPVAKMMGLKELPTLSVRKQRALEEELDENLSETCENIETKTPPPPIPSDRKTSNGIVALERSQQNVDHGHSSLQSTVKSGREPFDSIATSKLLYDGLRSETNTSQNANEPLRTSLSTGTIPKRSVKILSNDDPLSNATSASTKSSTSPLKIESSHTSKSKNTETEMDQITNFSLLYAENHPEVRDGKVEEPKEPTFMVPAEDTIKCYDNEGTPHTLLSTATSVSDLRPIAKLPISHNMHKHLKSERTTTDNSGINTPEKPIYYCEEGTPAYFSHHDSFSSLDEESELAKGNRALPHKADMLNRDDGSIHVNQLSSSQSFQQHGEPTSQDEHVPHHENADSNNCTVPTTPGEYSGKTVTFNEFNLETPMMFSRHSSLGSLASHEPALNDETCSVVSEISRMPSGIISPSEIPDSPSQSMPHSPRLVKVTENQSPRFATNVRSGTINSVATRRLPFEDEVKTFGVENTPALISCATSLSNLSLDDEPKITTDCLIKEMRLMHHLSDEQEDALTSTAIASTSSQQQNVELNRPIDDKPTDSCDEDLSDTDESINDSMLLAQCIDIGMRSKQIEDDITSPPALPEPNQVLDPTSSDDEEEDNVENEMLLEQCIRDGIHTTTGSIVMPSLNEQITPIIEPTLPLQQIIKENPIRMLRKGGNAYIETTSDETNRFHIEDSPCNYSVASGLSDLTVGSHTAGLLKTNRLSNIQSNNNHAVRENANENRSLSPISVDSEEDQFFLNQAIIAGQANLLSRLESNTLTTTNQHTLKKENDQYADAQYIESNSSISSIDSTDSANCNTDALLQQCIQVGMRKVNPNAIESAVSIPPRSHANQSSTRSHLPMFKGPSTPHNYQQHQHHHQQQRTRLSRREDEQLLLDCINMGIDRSIRLNSATTENTPPNLPPRAAHGSISSIKHDQASAAQKTIELQHQAGVHSKNAHTTSAAVSVVVGAPDVVMVYRNGTTASEPDRRQRDDIVWAERMNLNSGHDRNIRIVDDTIATTVALVQHEIGSNSTCALSTSILSSKSHNSFNMGNETAMLERSNEYPAVLGQSEYISDSEHSSSMDMEVSNECLFETLSPQKIDKHKDPDLMLQSVERLTHELVSTAEYLRTTNSNDDDSTVTENKKSFSASNNTWNDDTHPNEVSFPSISLSAPVIASMHDDDTSASDSNAGIRYEMADSEIIEEPTPTNDQKSFANSIIDHNENQAQSNELQFDIGGKINQSNFNDIMTNYAYNSANSYDTNSTLTNSTIIAIEANKIRTEIMQINGTTDSMMSLDKIRPPSAMDKMNNSSYCEQFNAPSSLKNSPGKFLTQGFMARRAIQNNNSAHGSMDSINSSCNLDRIKPPSLMDELLDSMISVDSIASEYIDHPQPQPIDDVSHYETAFSECDDMTTTLKSCADLPFDSTPCGSDFSSAESTPKKVCKSLTPRRKRQLTKERYQTYTIATDGNEIIQESLVNQQMTNASGAEQMISNGVDDAHFFQMKISNHALLINDNDSDAISLVSTDDGEMSSIHALTKKLTYLHDASINTNTYTKHIRTRVPADSQTTPTPSGDYFESLPADRSSDGSQNESPNKLTEIKSPRIIKPSNNVISASKDTTENDAAAESKGIRGRKKATYVSPYKMTKLAKPTPIKPVTSPIPNKIVNPTVQANKSPPVVKSVDTKAKTFIQRSAESLRKIRPTITAKLTKQNIAKTSPKASEENLSLNRQQSHHSAQTSETLIRQSTFIKDEPSVSEIPVISSEPSSPKKTKTIASRIPFNRTSSVQTTRNVTKCKTNIEIPSQKVASATFTRRNLKSASSTTHITSSTTSKLSLSPRSSLEMPSTSRSIFKKWSPPSKTTTIQSTASKSTIGKAASRESSGINIKNAKIDGVIKATAIHSNETSIKPSKIASCRSMSTNGRTSKV